VVAQGLAGGLPVAGQSAGDAGAATESVVGHDDDLHAVALGHGQRRVDARQVAHVGRGRVGGGRQVGDDPVAVDALVGADEAQAVIVEAVGVEHEADDVHAVGGVARDLGGRVEVVLAEEQVSAAEAVGQRLGDRGIQGSGVGADPGGGAGKRQRAQEAEQGRRGKHAVAGSVAGGTVVHRSSSIILSARQHPMAAGNVRALLTLIYKVAGVVPLRQGGRPTAVAAFGRWLLGILVLLQGALRRGAAGRVSVIEAGKRQAVARQDLLAFPGLAHRGQRAPRRRRGPLTTAHTPVTFYINVNTSVADARLVGRR